MIVNRSHGFVFVHVPKTAGTSVTALLSRYTRIGDAEIGGSSHGEEVQPFVEKRFGLHKHSTAAEIKNVLGEEYSTFFSFAFVRNPYARAYSLYRFQAQWLEGPHNAVVSTMTFEDYVFSELFTEHQDALSPPQRDWTHRDGAKLVDHVGQVERLSSSLLLILSIIERKPATGSRLESLTLLNHSGDADAWKECVAGEARKHVAKIYAPDFEAFGYEM
jgi:hypothetical protein